MSRHHAEFPAVAPWALLAVNAGFPNKKVDRRALAAFLREAMRQADDAAGVGGSPWQELAAIADNLHTPPPPPPTLAEAREAARQLGGANADVVHAFLATLGEGVQP